MGCPEWSRSDTHKPCRTATSFTRRGRPRHVSHGRLVERDRWVSRLVIDSESIRPQGGARHVGDRPAAMQSPLHDRRDENTGHDCGHSGHDTGHRGHAPVAGITPDGTARWIESGSDLGRPRRSPLPQLLPTALSVPTIPATTPGLPSWRVTHELASREWDRPSRELECACRRRQWFRTSHGEDAPAPHSSTASDGDRLRISRDSCSAIYLGGSPWAPFVTHRAAVTAVMAVIILTVGLTKY